MSHESKLKRWNPAPAVLPVGAAVTEVTPKERAQVEQLIANGKHGFAVDVAKQAHKRVGNAISEELLVHAYTARILSLAERNLDVDALALLELVQGRHPSSRDRLREVAAELKARGGGIEGLLELVADPSLPPEKIAGIEARIRSAAGDPWRIAQCNALPPEHPLRVAAGAVVRALGALTSGPVAAESLVLPEISRHSPLAPWKMLLRAIQALYVNEDALCEKYLAAVESTAPAARVVPAMRAMMGQKQKLTPASQDLVIKAGGRFAELRTTLANLDQALEKNNQGFVLQEIGRAVSLCKEVCPDQLERLKQHISVRAMMSGAKAERVTAAMGGPSLKNAAFWRLLARAYEETPHDPLSIPMACSVWDEFRKHALHEQWFPAKGPEIATLYLHMADLWRRVHDEQIERVVQRFAATFPGHGAYYAGQPAEIRALIPSGRLDCYFLSADTLFRRACEAHPCTENFQRWLKWAVQNAPNHADLVAERWTAALPHDIPPVLHLMQSAESTNALKRAFKLMEQAERLDGLNPDVRRARLRLLISLATRHLQQKKTHLAEPELKQFEALPQAQQGDRPALAAALRWVYWTLRGDTAQADDARARVVSLLGSEAAGQMILKAVASACKLKERIAEPKSAGGPLAAALGRACALGEDTGLPIVIPPALSSKLQRELSGRDVTADAVGLVALGEAALRAVDLELAYAVSATGLKLAQERGAEFLFLRARSLPDWEEERQALCAAGASELARRQRNADLLRRIAEWRDEEMIGMQGNDSDVAMSTEQVNSLIQRELNERGFPDYPDQREDYDSPCDCPVCRANRKGLPPALEQMMEEIGPEELIKAMGEMLRGGGMKPKKRRRSRPVFDENELLF